MKFFILTFPYSDVGFAQMIPGENAECICRALKQIFEHTGGVPTRIVFDPRYLRHVAAKIMGSPARHTTKATAPIASTMATLATT